MSLEPIFDLTPTSDEVIHLVPKDVSVSKYYDEDEDDDSDDEEEADEKPERKTSKNGNDDSDDEEDDEIWSETDEILKTKDPSKKEGEEDDENEEDDDEVPVNYQPSDLEEDSDEDDDLEEDDGALYLKKLDQNFKRNVIEEFHPETKTLSFEEIETLTRVVRNEYGEIVDPLHTTLPFLTKYERAYVLGQRAKQLEQGSRPMLPTEEIEDLVDGYLIAVKELEARKLPFIIARPLPGHVCEYWKLNDLL